MDTLKLSLVPNLSSEHITLFSQHRITLCSEALSLPLIQVADILGCDSITAKECILHISSFVCPPSRRVVELCDEIVSSSTLLSGSPSDVDLLRDTQPRLRYVSTGLTMLDDALRGGICAGTITECVGRSASGKTQFMLSVVAECVMHLLTLSHRHQRDSFSSLPCGVAYFDVEGSFDAIRFQEICSDRFPSLCSTDAEFVRIARHIHVLRVSSVEELCSILADMDDFIVDNEIAMICIDSVAALVRHQFASEQMASRQEKLVSLAVHLKRLSENFKLQVIVSNHASWKRTSTASKVSFATELEDALSMDVEPILGNSWSHCVQTRLLFSLSNTPVQGDSVGYIGVTKSPVAPRLAVSFRITSAGVVSARDDALDVSQVENIVIQRGTPDQNLS